jgi:endonuclease/exonuclease/phosphatase family metal-dependent hydrolase
MTDPGAALPAAFPMLTWNLFHGRDHPPDAGLRTWRSRLLRVTERSATHVQVNRSLLDEFGTVVANGTWSICLLQEVPPLWARPLADRCGADLHRVLTSRNQLAPLRQRLGRWNPDLMGSWEGGSNVTLVRPPWRIVERGDALLNPLPRRAFRERRRISLTRVVAGDVELSVGNLHASAGSRGQAEQDVRYGAERALAFARGRPLVLGGDFNLRPRTSRIFDELERRFGLAHRTAGPAADEAIDHLLARGLEVLEPPHRWPPEARELPAGRHPWGTGRLRLSDHVPVEAVFRAPPPVLR